MILFSQYIRMIQKKGSSRRIRSFSILLLFDQINNHWADRDSGSQGQDEKDVI